MKIEQFIDYFSSAKRNGNNSYQVKCPAHDDSTASLTITEQDDKILMHCHAGCDTVAILNSIGLSEKDLFNNKKNEKPRIVKEYIYKDKYNNPKYKVVRYEPKTFKQCKYEDGKWHYNMQNVEYVPYNLKQVLESEEIFFVEGEKDADNLISIGLVATTTAGGAVGFDKRRDVYAPYFKDKVVYIIPDHDKSGYSYAETIKSALNRFSKEIKVLKIADKISDLKEKSDISDILNKNGKEYTLELLKSLINEDCKILIDTELNSETIFSIDFLEKIYELELSDPNEYMKKFLDIKNYCIANKLTGFEKTYRMYKDTKKVKTNNSKGVLLFPEITDKAFVTNRYEMDNNGFIYEEIPNIGKMLVCYHPILPLERYKIYTENAEKIKIGFYKDYEWKNIVVDKSVVSSNQSIIKLADVGISVTSENAKSLVKYISEIENLNGDIIPTVSYVNKMGWVKDKLMPYDDDIYIDESNGVSNIKEKFSESGKLEDWVKFFTTRRKENLVTRVIMASAVISIFLKELKQSGFTLHIYGETEVGKSVVCMVGQSIFGNPTQIEDLGIGINFNMTNVGLEYKLNTYNHIPLFINEMQHQKDLKDYDKLLFLISEGKGKTRSTKNGGIMKSNSWNNVVITNGEKSIVKDNSNAGAINRCIPYELKEYSFKDLPETADFVKENYGTPIRKILKEIGNYDIKNIFKNFQKIESDDISKKQKIMKSLILTGDKIVTDILFKDEDYIVPEEFNDMMIKKQEIMIEERAYELVKDWYASEIRHFLDTNDQNSSDIKVELYGKKIKDGFVAFIPSILKNKLESNGFDFMEVLKAWKRKGIISTDKDRERRTKLIRILEERVRCVVIDMDKDLDNSYEKLIEEEELPF